MKKYFMAILAGVFLLGACSAAYGIEISSPWIRPTLQGDNGAVYFLLQNHSVGRDELTGISSDIAEAVEIHESRMEGDVMQMRSVTSLPVAGKQSIEFGPGGYHAMLVGLKKELKPGDEIEVTLHFKEHEDIRVTVPVQEMAPGETAD